MAYDADELDRWDYSPGVPHDRYSEIHYEYTDAGPVAHDHDSPDWDRFSE